LGKKRFILNADDFGMSTAFNRAILEGCAFELLKSASLTANGDAFEEAVNKIIPKCPNLGIGIHLNITEGKALGKDLDLITDTNGNFNKSYFQILYKTYFDKESDFLAQVEREFRLQIERILTKTNVTHIDSHMHIHAIPKIFEMVCRLAKEYRIKQIRTHFEKIYYVPDISRHCNTTFLKNLSKVLLFDIFSIFNENTALEYELATNDNIIGILYSSLADAFSFSYGVKSLRNKERTIEAIIHPCRYDDGTIDNRFTEYLVTKNKKLKNKIEKMGFEITNYDKKEN